MISLIKTILAIKSDAQVSIEAEDINQITWHDNNPTNITNEQILAKQIELQSEYDAKQYQRDRASAYPSIQEQLDMQYWDKVNGTTNWEDAIAKVKLDNPKP
tara:strand:- start:46 stop:351 length:306 start_codon:yes stop_codon:yes gene_type:complete